MYSCTLPLSDEEVRPEPGSMERFHVSPREGHYACMVDILGRSGRLERAVELVRALPMEPSAAVWGSLRRPCRTFAGEGSCTRSR